MKTTFLSFIISEDSLEIDAKKANTVLNWEILNSIKNILCFLSFANFYHYFIYRYWYLCQPLFNLLIKDTPFIWDIAYKQGFEPLKTVFTSTPIL